MMIHAPLTHFQSEDLGRTKKDTIYNRNDITLLRKQETFSHRSCHWIYNLLHLSWFISYQWRNWHKYSGHWRQCLLVGSEVH